MKSSFSKFAHSDELLEGALRQSAPKPDVPAALHDSIMQAVEEVALRSPTGRQSAWPQMFSGEMQRWMRNVRVGWLQAPALACVTLVGIWFVFHLRPQRASSNTPNLAEISAAFSTGQEMVDALPSATVGPLADELNNVNRDLDRTTEFLLATLP